jgi:prevent-host-death family protein
MVAGAVWSKLYNSAHFAHLAVPFRAAMLKLTSAAARRDLADIIRTVRTTKQRAVITRYGQPLVAIVPMEDLARLDPRANGSSKPRPRKPGARRLGPGE